MMTFGRILRDPMPPSGGSISGGAPAEAGQIDNRLSLDPSDTRWQKLLGGWDDGGEYTVTMTINQISPGEFEVKSMKEAPEDEAKEDVGDDKGEDKGADYGGNENPALAKLMD